MHDERIPANGNTADLRQLPVFAPDPALWARVVAARQQHVRMRRLRQGGFAMAAAAAIAAVVVLLPRPQIAQQPVVADQTESRQLENEWQQLAGQMHSDGGGMLRVRAIDAALQSAYDRRADENELAALWRQRNQALRGLIAQQRDAGNGDLPALTRI